MRFPLDSGFSRPAAAHATQMFSTQATLWFTVMKKIEAIIQPFKLIEVKEALQGAGIDGMTTSEVQGHGRQKGHHQVYRGNEYQVDLIPKVKVEVVVPESRAEEVIEILTTAARSGKIGDGKIFVSDISEVVRIRNGDRGESAL